MTTSSATLEAQILGPDADLAGVASLVADVYAREHAWSPDGVAEHLRPRRVASEHLRWWLATRGGEPVGVCRLLAGPLRPFLGPYGLEERADGACSVDTLLDCPRAIMLGRLAVAASERGGLDVVSLLLGSLVTIFERERTSYCVVDVFPDAALSFYEGHGFVWTATHHAAEDVGSVDEQRILVLDVAKARLEPPPWLDDVSPLAGAHV